MNRPVNTEQLTFVSISVVPVSNIPSTQCVAFMYGLDEAGRVWFKRNNDDHWSPEPMESNGSKHEITQD